MDSSRIILFIFTIFLSASTSLADDNGCEGWRQTYYGYCIQRPRPQEYEDSCRRYEIVCLHANGNQQGGSNSGNGGGGNGNGGGGNGGSNSGNGFGGSGNGGGGLANAWNQLTRQAQYEQTAQMNQAIANANRGQYDCVQYNSNKNVWCGPAPVNPTYCKMLSGACFTDAQNTARGDPGPTGNGFSNRGMPTGGAGSTRPLTIGRGLNVGPFFEFGKSLAINPLQGVGRKTGVSVPIAGIDVSGGRYVDYGGLLGVTQLGQLLNGRRRRRAIRRTFQFNRLYAIH